MKLFIKFSNYLLKILPIINYTYYKNELCIYIPTEKIIPIFFFLKNHSHCQFKILSDIVAIDYINNKETFPSTSRPSLIRLLLSILTYLD